MKAKLMFLQALSPIHAGTGQGVGAIDLPVAREKSTGIPIVPGSTIKGVLRANYEGDNKVHIFGPETENAHEYAGSAQFSDLRLLFLPVRSLAGTFAWVTSPLLLQRFQRDCAMTSTSISNFISSISKKNICLIPAYDSKLIMQIGGQTHQIVLEDLRFTCQEDTALSGLLDWLKIHLFGIDTAWQSLFTERVCVVHDDVLSFLLDTATEITARIRLDADKKTVVQGALWYEEALPTESILSGMMIIHPVRAEEDEVLTAIKNLTDSPLQIGGSATVGRGLCRLHLASEGK